MGEAANSEAKPLRKVMRKYYKMQIRRLPYEITEEELLQKLSPLPPYKRFWFRSGEEYLEDDGFPYAFIVFDSFDEAAKFQNRFNGQLFIDSDGNETNVIVEKAPNQDFSKEPLKPKPGVTPIVEDIGFIQFMEEVQAKSITKKVDFDVLVNEITERERKLAEGICQDTPLTDYFIKKVHEKILKNRPRSKKPEPKAPAKVERGERKPNGAYGRDRKEKPARPPRESKNRGGESSQKDKAAAAGNEKKKRERPPRILARNENKKPQSSKDGDETLKQNGMNPDSELPAKNEPKTSEDKLSTPESSVAEEKPKERKELGPSRRNKDRPERAIYQPGRGRRGGKAAAPKPATETTTTQNENADAVEEAK